MTLFRAHGLGNDYLIVEAGELPSPQQIRALCQRHTGVGSDGLLVPVQAEGSLGVRIFNPDGSEAEKSGNGLRIFAWWAHHVLQQPASLNLWTKGGVVHAEVQGEWVRVAMGVAKLWGPELLAGQPCCRVDIGNPHAIVEGIPDHWEPLGEKMEGAVAGRTNVQFFQIRNHNTVEIRIWERGAGPTQASGSSACAVAVVAVRKHGLESPLWVDMPGGRLKVHVLADGCVEQEGPVEPIGRIELDFRWIGAHP